MARPIKYLVETTIFDSTVESEEHRKNVAFWRFQSEAQLEKSVRTWADMLKEGQSFSMTIERVGAPKPVSHHGF